jgi:restriction system protein
MSVPGYQEFMLPLLRIASDGQEHTVTEAMDTIAQQMGISDRDRDEPLPSGTQTRFYNRVTWALTYLSKSLLLEKVGRGRFRITSRGSEVIGREPRRVDNAFLEQFAEYRAFKTKRAERASQTRADADDAGSSNPIVTPDERLDSAYKELRETLADDLLERVRTGTPKFFEHLVVDLLVKMGYGGSYTDAAQVVGKSGDEGIDGVIKEDRLGLDMVYVQAKKWDASVGGAEIDRFVGSLMRKKAHKGVFITTGTFSAGGIKAAQEASAKIVLIDGERLTELMIDHGVGVTDHKSYTIRRIDSDYFETQ